MTHQYIPKMERDTANGENFDENYQNLINEFKENVVRGSGGDPRPQKIEKNEYLADFYKIREFVLGKTSRLRTFLVLFLKEITWRNELKNIFDIHPTHLDEIFEFFKENDLIVFKPLIEVDNLLFETVIKQQSIKFYAQRERVKVYTLTPKGKNYGINLIDDISLLCKNNPTLNLHMQEIIKKTENHKKIMSKILLEENQSNQRTVVYPDGFIEIRKTLRSKKIERDTQQAITELKQERLLENGKGRIN